MKMSRINGGALHKVVSGRLAGYCIDEVSERLPLAVQPASDKEDQSSLESEFTLTHEAEPGISRKFSQGLAFEWAARAREEDFLMPHLTKGEKLSLLPREEAFPRDRKQWRPIVVNPPQQDQVALFQRIQQSEVQMWKNRLIMSVAAFLTVLVMACSGVGYFVTNYSWARKGTQISLQVESGWPQKIALCGTEEGASAKPRG